MARTQDLRAVAPQLFQTQDALLALATQYATLVRQVLERATLPATEDPAAIAAALTTMDDNLATCGATLRGLRQQCEPLVSVGGPPMRSR